jgi:phosphoglycerate dehydrogenase-like enzyme
MKIVLQTRDEPGLAERVRAAAGAHGAAVVEVTDDRSAVREIADADAFYGTITPELLGAATRLRWIQSPVIGLERTMFPELVGHPAVLTNPRGIFSDDIADHVLGFVLCFARGFHRHVRTQLQRRWVRWSEEQVIHLPDATIGIFGLGGIGTAVAQRARAHGMRVLAVDARRAPQAAASSTEGAASSTEGVERLWGPEGLGEMLGQSDFVAICAPETPETRGLFDAPALGRMKRGAYLINIGRGKIVRLDALVAALESGHLAGAGLDVFEVEPLPADHPLWGMENVIVTPHMAGLGPHTAARRHEILLENVRRFAAGRELINAVDKTRWF